MSASRRVSAIQLSGKSLRTRSVLTPPAGFPFESRIPRLSPKPRMEGKAVATLETGSPSLRSLWCGQEEGDDRHSPFDLRADFRGGDDRFAGPLPSTSRRRRGANCPWRPEAYRQRSDTQESHRASPAPAQPQDWRQRHSASPSDGWRVSPPVVLVPDTERFQAGASATRLQQPLESQRLRHLDKAGAVSVTGSPRAAGGSIAATANLGNRCEQRARQPQEQSGKDENFPDDDCPKNSVAPMTASAGGDEARSRVCKRKEKRKTSRCSRRANRDANTSSASLRGYSAFSRESPTANDRPATVTACSLALSCVPSWGRTRGGLPGFAPSGSGSCLQSSAPVPDSDPKRAQPRTPNVICGRRGWGSNHNP